MLIVTLCLFSGLYSCHGLTLHKSYQAQEKQLSSVDLLGPSLTNMVLASQSLHRTDESQRLVHELVEVGRIDGIPVLTVETRINHRALFFPGAPGSIVRNIGFNHTWQKKAKTKNQIFQEYIDARMETPDQLVIMVDGGDVVWGGCDSNFLRSTYESIVNASNGAKVVLGAEFSVYPLSWMRHAKAVMRREKFELRRQAVLEALGHPVVKRPWDAQWQRLLKTRASKNDDVESGDFKQFPIIDDMYADRSICTQRRSFCSDPPRYQYANYGFVMGPIGELKPLIDKINADQMLNPKAIDQGTVVWYHMYHQKAVTLDYSGTLMLNMHNFLGDVQGIIPEFLQIDERERKIFNTVTGKQQCFLHGNGRAKHVIKALAHELNRLWRSPLEPQ